MDINNPAKTNPRNISFGLMRGFNMYKLSLNKIKIKIQNKMK